jgi:hypothetical protein
MPFGSLWLPFLVSAVVVWIASAILHMALKYHRADYRALPDEEAVGAAMRKTALAPGYYVIPYCPDPGKMKDPDVVRRYETGPVAQIAVLRNGAPALPKYLFLWFLFCLLVSFICAYLARNTLLQGVSGMTVCRLTGTVAFVGYGLGNFQNSIWRGMPWSNSLRELADSVIYAVLTGLVFAWLWPDA